MGVEDPARPRSWLIAVAALRAALTASALVALYYLLPLDHGAALITAKTESARLIVTAQIVLDLIILGLGARIILGAMQRSREQRTPPKSG